MIRSRVIKLKIHKNSIKPVINVKPLNIQQNWLKLNDNEHLQEFFIYSFYDCNKMQYKGQSVSIAH